MYKLSMLFIFYIFSKTIIAQSIEIQSGKFSQADQILLDRGEIEFKFRVDNKEMINKDLTRTISIEKVITLPEGQGFEVYAFASKAQFHEFLDLNIEYDIIDPFQLRSLKMAYTTAEMENWDAYPTYQVYEKMMASFAEKFPELCKIDTILSSTPSGNYKILAAKISDHPDESENEPQFLYSSTIHGNETAGYILMLRLVDYLLNNYSGSQQIKNLIDNVEIWICPLANPDGTYFKSDPPGNTISNAKRSNLLNVNLNRNYPDPELGPHPDGNIYQAETQAFMNFAGEHHFNMSANFHSGAELLNYPWDTWTTDENPNADAAWWEKVCTEYVDTSRLVNPIYMTSDFTDGVSEGGDWYVINGGRQDYMNYFKNCREVTIEIDNVSITETQNLNKKWHENYRSLLNYIQESTFGVRGIITDSLSGKPIRAMVWVNGYDQENDSSQVYSALPVGNYHKYMIAGDYNITFSAPGYHSKTFDNVMLENNIATILDVSLVPLTSKIYEQNLINRIIVYPNPIADKLYIEPNPNENDNFCISINSITGQQVYFENNISLSVRESIDISDLPNGLYILRIWHGTNLRNIKFQKIN
jgi:hypothetical protein